jgi:cation transport regulator ChaC
VSDLAYVFGYGSLVALEDAEAAPGRLRGYRRFWGAAMNNWEGGDAVKHFLDPTTGERPRVRVAYLDVYERSGSAVNGLALPVDAARLAALDAREVNYSRVEVTNAFEPTARMPDASLPARSSASIRRRVFTYVGRDAARERCRQGVADGNAFVSRDYVVAVRRAFERLGAGALTEFDRTTDPLPFPERDLRVAGRAGS